MHRESINFLGDAQVFICIDLKRLPHYPSIENAIHSIITDYHSSRMENENKEAVYPGERVMLTRKENLEKGIPVLSTIWEEIIKLKK